MADSYVTLSVKNLADSRRFWQQGAGLAVSGEYPGQLCLRHGALEILLDATGETAPAPGLEIGLRLPREQFDAALARLGALGCQPLRGPKNFGGPLGYETALRDPDGHCLVLFDDTVAAPAVLPDPSAILSSLTANVALLQSLCADLERGKRARRPTPEKWSAHEHVCHLAAVHTLFSTRLDLMLREHNPAITPYNPGPDEATRYAAMDFDRALADFARDRAALVKCLQNLNAADWQRAARHPEYSRYSIFIMCRHFALHDLLHAYRIEQIVLGS